MRYKDFYRDLLTESDHSEYKIRGEYWIQGGSIQFADGDVGDYNHESIVIQHAQADILNYLDIESDELEMGHDFEGLVEKGLREEGIEIPEDYDLEETFYNFIKDQFSEAEANKCRELYKVATDRTDVRLFAKKNWGWISVNGLDIGLYELTPETKKNLIDGIDNILSDDGADDVTDEQVHLFIGVDKTGKHYSITLDELRDGSFGTGGTKAGSVTKSDVIDKLDKSIQHPFYKDRIDEVHEHNLSDLLVENVVKVAIEDILPHESDMNVAVDSLYKGMEAQSSGPVSAYQLGDKYVLVDGHHRLLRAIINGEAYIKVNVLPPDKNISTNGTIELDFLDGDYYGLDSKLTDGWLLKRL